MVLTTFQHLDLQISEDNWHVFLFGKWKQSCYENPNDRVTRRVRERPREEKQADSELDNRQRRQITESKQTDGGSVHTVGKD